MLYIKWPFKPCILGIKLQTLLKSNFEVIAGRSATEIGDIKIFALVSARRLLFYR